MIRARFGGKVSANFLAYGVSFVALSGLLLLAPPAPAEVVKAEKADNFVDMFGVVVHISRGNGVLADDEENWPNVRDGIAEVGFRYVRTTLTKTMWIPRALDMYARGIRFDFRIDSRPLAGGGGNGAELDPTRIPEMVDMAKQVGIDAILSFECANEYNANWETLPGWAGQLKAFMSELKDRVTEDPEIADKPIVAPAIWRRKVEDYQAMADLNIAKDTTKGNLHNYTGGRLPGYELEDRIADARTMTGDQPIWVTEYGYRTDDTDHVSETAKAKYLPRYAGLLFNDERVERAFNFQIIDEWPAEERPDSTWGLLDNNFGKRPAFYAMKNTFALLADAAGGDFGTGSLDYQLNGASSDIRHFLVQKSDGRFLLGIWREVESYSQETEADIDVAPQEVELAFNTPVLQARTFLPTALHVPLSPDDGTLPVCLDPDGSDCDNGTYSLPMSIVLPVPDQLVIVEITRDGDAFSPSIPADVAVAQGNKRYVTVSWDASSDNVGVVTYKLYESGNPWRTTTGTSYTFRGRKGRTYAFSVSAVDAAGNESARSEPVVLTVK